MSAHRIAMSVCLGLGLTIIAGQAAAADADSGARLAGRVCAQCHVGTTQARGTDAVPSLAAIARNPAQTDERLRAFLAAPHAPMPDLSLTRAEIEDVIAHLRRMPN